METQPNEQAEPEKHTENIDPTDKRTALFGHLDYAISLSREKSGKEKAKNTERMSWTRILIQAVQCYGQMLADTQLADIEERLSRLDQQGQPETLSSLIEHEDILLRLKKQSDREEMEAQHDRETETPIETG